MSPLKTYQQLIQRLTISILFTLIDAVVVSVCVLKTPLGRPGFWAVPPLTDLLVWTLWTMWGHALADAKTVKAAVSAAESQYKSTAKQAA
jgi:hypothetical protein